MTASLPLIVVTGNIAAGKSTLVDALARELGLAPYPERVDENPFFGWPTERSLQTEAWFLADAAAVHRGIQRGGRGGIQERCIYEQEPVFAQARFRCGWLSADELGLLGKLATLLEDGLRCPDLLVYVDADVPSILPRIAARGRPQEQALDAAYLGLLAELYDEFVADWERSPVYRLDTARVDVRRHEAFRLACCEIQELLP